jgi:hypothetical protein
MAYDPDDALYKAAILRNAQRKTRTPLRSLARRHFLEQAERERRSLSEQSPTQEEDDVE